MDLTSRLRQIADTGQLVHTMTWDEIGKACGEASARIAELERALRRVVVASCDVERDSALVHARHVLNGQ